MKNLLKLTLVLLLLVSCKDAPESKESKIAEGLINEITGKNDNVNERYNLLMKDLSTKTLLSNEQLLEAYPKKLGSLKLDTDEGRITSDKTVMGSFGDGTIRLEILDAAGENMTGAIIPLKMLHLNKITSEYNNTIRYSKKERNGVLTFGTDRDKDTKSDYQAELRFLYDNRFYVTLEGKAMNVDELWDAIGVDDLKRFKEFNK
ncbi:hypothetical protein [Maribacter arcticus]|jgi:hypothetical protein|uniref:hypothetical protein n=1 Tax=Maribacter arcticus TaxID=561365 RepID=UPI0030D96D98